MLTLKNTKSTCLLLPMYGRQTSWYGSQFINCYIGDKDHPELDNNLLFLFKFIGSRDFTEFEKALKSSQYYITDYDPTPEHVMFVFRIPEESKEDYDLFKKGLYSRMSVRLKTMILGSRTSGANYDILTRNSILRKALEERLAVEILPSAELMSAPDNREIFDASSFKPIKLKINRGTIGELDEDKYTDLEEE